MNKIKELKEIEIKLEKLKKQETIVNITKELLSSQKKYFYQIFKDIFAN